MRLVGYFLRRLKDEGGEGVEENNHFDSYQLINSNLL